MLFHINKNKNILIFSDMNQKVLNYSPLPIYSSSIKDILFGK